MSKYQEALMEVEGIAYKQYEDACYYKTTKARAMEYERKLKDATKILQELVDKETPMKPTLKRGIYDIRCSKCGNPNLNTKWTYGRYCSGCGQKIDWSDEE